MATVTLALNPNTNIDDVYEKLLELYPEVSINSHSVSVYNVDLSESTAIQAIIDAPSTPTDEQMMREAQAVLNRANKILQKAFIKSDNNLANTYNALMGLRNESSLFTTIVNKQLDLLALSRGWLNILNDNTNVGKARLIEAVEIVVRRYSNSIE